MNNNIQCSIESSTTSMELNSAADGIYLVPELEGIAGLPEIRTTSGVNAGYDGGWTSAQNYDARLIAIRGVIANKDIAKVEAMRRKLASLLGQGRKEQLTLRFTTEAGNAYTISVRTISCEMALQRVLNKQDFLIQLRADDPLIYDDGASGGTEAILRVQQALGGFEINFGLPLAIGGSSDATAVENGAETVYPIIKLYGPLHSPTVVNMTTNQQMQIIADLGYTINWSGWTGVSGERLSIPNELDKEAPLRLWSVDGNATQTTYRGKNLFNIAQVNNLALGETILEQSVYRGYSLKVSAGQTYTVSRASTSTPNRFRICFTEVEPAVGVDYYNSQGTRKAYDGNESMTSVTATVPQGMEYLFVYLSNLDQTITEAMQIQIEQSATKTDYEPYVGGTPAPNPSYPQPISVVTGENIINVTGENLFDGNFRQGSWYSRTTTNRIFTTQVLPVAAGQAYTISLSGLPSGYRYAVALRSEPFNASGTPSLSFDSGWKTATSFTFTPSSDGYYGMTVSRTNEADITPSEIDNVSIQLEIGSSVSSYQEYNGARYAINLGKNLFDIDTAVTRFENVGGTQMNDWGTYQDGIVTVVKSNGAHGTCAFAGFKPTIIKGETYTLSATVRLSGTNATSAIRFGLVTNSGTALTISGKDEWIRVTKTFTATAQDAADRRVDIQASNTGNIIEIKEVQLQAGNLSTAYAPYFAPIELAKIGTNQDRIYKYGEKWYVEKNTFSKIFDGSESWGIQGTRTHTFYSSLPATSMTGICDHFTGISSSGFDVTEGCYLANSNRFIVSFPSMNSADDLKTWLTANPTKIVCGVASASALHTITEITNQTLIDQLEALVNISITTGIHNIFTEVASGNLNPVMILNFIEVVSRRVTLVPETPVRLALTDGGIINACGCRKDVQLTMRETIE